MTTPRQLQQSMPRGGGTSARVVQLYEQGDAEVAQLVSNGSVTASDLERLDRRSRCAVASSHWALCTPAARAALLADEHHFVRSCASISAR